MTIEQLRSPGVQAVALIALIAHPAFLEKDLELPAGEVMGGGGLSRTTVPACCKKMKRPHVKK